LKATDADAGACASCSAGAGAATLAMAGSGVGSAKLATAGSGSGSGSATACAMKSLVRLPNGHSPELSFDNFLILQNSFAQNQNEIILAHKSLLFDFIRLQRAMHKMSSLGHSPGVHASGFKLGRPRD
jgi:hypothetical protein